MSTYQFVEVVGTSTVSWEDATKQAVDDARQGFKGIRVAEVVQMDVKVIGATMFYRVRLKVSFKVASLKKYAELLGASESDDD
jgi:flavin-binding protein dodecin